MSIKNVKIPNLRRFKTAESGNITIVMALSLGVILMATGAAVDYSLTSNTISQTQHMADISALTAAIYVKENGRLPENKQEGLIGEYTAKELGYNYSDMVKGGSSGVTATVTYDTSVNEVQVTVKGETVSTFSRLLGKNTLPFGAVSKVKYEHQQVSTPISVLMILDNSGTMALDDKPDRDSTATKRITTLQAGLTSFRETLANIHDATPDESPRAIRTAMTTYNRELGEIQIPPMWGVYSQATVDSMSSKLNAGTDSSVSMTKIKDWVADEDTYHAYENRNYNTNVEARKIVIFMTDGANEGRAQTCVDMKVKRHQHWVRKSDGWVNHNEPGNTSNFDYLWSHSSGIDDENRLECIRPAPADGPTLEDCETIKAEPNTEIYTMGYGLEPGRYYVGANNSHNGSNLSFENSTKAYHLLETCASSPEHFFKATNAEDLLNEFENIGTQIVNTTLRLSH